MAKLQFIPNATSKNGGVAALTLEDVPQDVREDVEQVYDALKTNPGRMRVSFDSLVELNQYIAQVKAYCELRPAGAIRFRKSPTRGLPNTTMDFRITDPETPNETEVREIRETVEQVKDQAKTVAKK